ncbi:MAG: efflux RND transporter periplasmic adaptor subunit [Desulfobacterales bacterium]|nr:efflux RND transporter periplasmic adaptor subunit [Desulfobacterales bacterium]
MKKIILPVLLVILIVAGAVLLKKRSQTIAAAPMATPMSHPVKTVLPENRTVFQTSTFLARLESATSVAISSKLSGRISELLVDESREVGQGDLLVRIDDQEILAAIAALRAKLAAAREQNDYSRTQYERNKAMFKVGGLARERLEAAGVALGVAGATVTDLEQKIRGLENQLDYLNLRAPFAGIVGTVFLHQGDLASPGRPIISLNSLPQKLTFSFMPGPAEIRPGMEVLLQGGKAGKITRLYNDARGGLSVAEVVLDRRLDRPNGSYLTIELVVKSGSGCGVPVRALLHRDRGESIMLLQGDRFAEKAVTVKARDKKFALIDPCPATPVAVAAEAKLGLLPSYGRIKVIREKNNE